MSYKDEKIVKVMLGEVANVDERCDGYHEELAEALGDIVQRERSHLFQRSNIVVEIGDIIGRVSTFVGQRAGKGGTEK